MSDDRQAPRRRRRPPVAPGAAGAYAHHRGQRGGHAGLDGFRYQRRGLPAERGERNPNRKRPERVVRRRSGNPDDFADEAAAQRPKRGARRAHGVGGKEDRRAESRTKNRFVRAESARPKEKKRAPDEQKGKRAPRASNPPNDHRRALRRDRRACWRSSHSRGRRFGGTSSRALERGDGVFYPNIYVNNIRFRAKRSTKRRRSSPSRCSR